MPRVALDLENPEDLAVLGTTGWRIAPRPGSWGTQPRAGGGTAGSRSSTAGLRRLMVGTRRRLSGTAVCGIYFRLVPAPHYCSRTSQRAGHCRRPHLVRDQCRQLWGNLYRRRNRPGEMDNFRQQHSATSFGGGIVNARQHACNSRAGLQRSLCRTGGHHLHALRHAGLRVTRSLALGPE